VTTQSTGTASQAGQQGHGAARVTRLTAEHHAPGAALGTGHAEPRLSWRVAVGTPDWEQSRFEVELLDRDGARLETTGEVVSRDQVLLAWPFHPLVSGQAVQVRVRVAGGEDPPGPWSAPEPVEVGLLSPLEWSATAITADGPGPVVESGRAPRLRREFPVGPGLVRARLRITAQGLHETWLNGARVGDEELEPGWTSYAHRLRYRTHDVGALLREGSNTLGSLLGNGWSRGRLTWSGTRGVYGARRTLFAQLELTYADGRTERVVTDGAWRTAPGHLLSDDLYDGERVDLRDRDDAWLSPGFDDSRWARVAEVPLDPALLVAPDGPPVRRTRTVVPDTVTPSPEQGWLVDFGENVVGWVRLRVRGVPAGTTVTVRHAEVLDGGRLGTRPLRSAEATDTYVLAGEQEVVLEPRFTFHGFRYAEISGLPDGAAAPGATDVEAVVLSSDLERTGWFDCSEPDLVRFHENVVRGMRGNFLDVPTDCPQRDERLGWTGDLQVFSPTASFLFDSAGFLTSWLADLAADQTADGTVPVVVPNVLPGDPPPAAAWGDAAVVVPYVVHERSGDLGLLERQLPSMTAWVQRLAVAAGADHVWSGGFQYGDWLDPTAPPDDAAAAQADPDVVATAQFARSAHLLSLAAAMVGRPQEAARHRELAGAVRRAFAGEFTTPAGRVLSDCPTVYAQALVWDLLPAPAQRDRAGDRLADLVRTAGFRISTGFVGTPLVCEALAATGHLDVAYRLLLQRACPSWLYPVTMGATTVWERWDSMLPDGSINPGSMTSFNHYALGAVADWLHRSVAGLAPASPGYRRVVVRPLPGGGLTRASARHTSPYGTVSVAWRVEGVTWTLDVVVPPGCRAEVHLPDGSPSTDVGSGTHAWSLPWPPAGRAARAPVTLESPLRELLDDTVAWPAVAAELVRWGIGTDDAAVARRAGPLLDRAVAEFAAAVSPAATPDGRRLLTSVTTVLHDCSS